MMLLPLNGAAQDQSTPAPRLLVITREEVKPGKTMAHQESESERAHALQLLHWPLPRLALSSVSGPEQVWFISAYRSFAEMEKASHAEDASAAFRKIRQQYSRAENDSLSRRDTLTCVLAPDMSYRQEFYRPGTRYFRVRFTRVKTGHDADYRELRKLINLDEYEKAGRDIHLLVYHVTGGAPSGTYITLFPMNSLAEWDEPSRPARGLFGSDYDKMLDLMDKSVVDWEDALFEISNTMTVPASEWLKADPGFWAPKAAPPGTAHKKQSRAR